MRVPKGFTSIELVVTVVITGLLASVAVASLGPLLKDRRLREASQQIEQTIRKAQQLARTKDQMTYVQFNGQNTTTYTLFAGNPCTAVAPSFSSVETLSQNMQVLGTTLDFGNCPDTTTRQNIIAFNNQGNLTSSTGTTSNVGRCIGISDSTQPAADRSGYIIAIMTAAGDISSFKVDDAVVGCPGS